MAGFFSIPHLGSHYRHLLCRQAITCRCGEASNGSSGFRLYIINQAGKRRPPPWEQGILIPRNLLSKNSCEYWKTCQRNPGTRFARLRFVLRRFLPAHLRQLGILERIQA